MKKSVFKVPITEFAVPVPRTGSIEVNSGYGLLSQDAPESHYALQRQRVESVAGYRPEVRVSHSAKSGKYSFAIGGRADGVYEQGSRVVIEEIKTAIDIRQLAQRLKEDRYHPYCLQLRTYGYFLMHDMKLEVEPRLRFLLSSLCDGSTSEVEIDLDTNDFKEWFERRLKDLEAETKHRIARMARREKLAASLNFPFDSYRKGQDELREFVSQCTSSKAPCMVQAPTGLGKTMAVLFPSLQDALSRGQRLVYVTPKNSQHAIASQAIEHLRKTSKIKSLVLTAKSKLCLKEEQTCHPDYCEYARDYYRKVYENDLPRKISRKAEMTADDFLKYGKKHEVCPFELSIDTLAEADVIIGDYNYVFSPMGLLGRLSSPDAKESERPNLVVDEAHNLPARSMSYYSGAISTAALLVLKKELMARSSSSLTVQQGIVLADECLSLVESSVKAASTKVVVRAHADAVEQSLDSKTNDQFVQTDLKLRAVLAQHLATGSRSTGDALVELCNIWSNFTAVMQFKGEQFFKTGRRTGDGAVLKVTCSDASEKLERIYESFSSVVLFSATLKPFDYYVSLCGLDPETIKVSEFESPFPKNNRKLLVIPQVSTKYEDRTKNYGKIKDAIRRIVLQRQGNYFVFVPSFSFLEQVCDLGDLKEFQVLKQVHDMKLSHVNEYLRVLRDGVTPTIIFAVQGGVFSEGVDYPGDSLIGAIVVGPSLPLFDEERERMRAYYETKYGAGFDFAYVYPAMSRVVQSAGRVIRSENDKGLIVLMDGRFLSERYVKAMPRDWYDDSVRELVSNRILSDIQEFWGSSP